MAIEGNLELFQLPEILQMVSMQRKTGILTVQGENDIVAISFKEGQVVAADALNQTVEEGLGQVLARQGLVSPDAFTTALREHETTGKRLLDLLVEQGLLDRGQLLDALRLQTYQLLLHLLRWDEGEFKFYSGDEVAFEEGFSAISVEELLIRSVEDLGEEGGPGREMPDLERCYRAVPGGANLKIVGVDGEGPMEDSAAVWLSAEENLILERLDGEASAAVVAQATELGDYKVLFTLYRLLQAGAVRPVDSESPPPTMPRPVEMPEPATPVQPVVEMPQAFEPLPVEMPKPEEVIPKPVRRRRPVRQPAPLEWGAWVGWGAALLGALVLFSQPWRDLQSVLLPFPWQEVTVVAQRENQAAALHQRIDRTARTYFLLEGHYPDGLHNLVNLRLLPPRALRDPAHRVLAYSSDDVSYLLQPVVKGQPVAEGSVREAVTGDFLLDPEFLGAPGRAEEVPLVLLD